MLFFSQADEPREPQPLTSTKRDKFRKEIRRSELRGRFKELREKLMLNLNSQNMMETMAKLRGSFNEQEFREVVCGLEQSCKSEDFNIYAVTNKLQAMLLQILKNQEHLLTRVDASRVLYLLSLLTYYSQEAVDSIIKQQDFIVDHLRKSMEKLEMGTVEDVKYFNQAVCILLNLSASFNSDFNKFLVQSGYCSMVNRHLARTIVPARESDNLNYKQLVAEARVFSLKLFKNIVHQQEDFELTTADLVRDVLLDEQNMKQYPYHTLLMLTKAMEQGQDKFWKHLTTSKLSSEISNSIYNAMVLFQERWEGKQFLEDPSECLTKEQKMNFFAQASFLNQLYYTNKAFEIDFQSTIENTLNGYMLAQFIIESDRDCAHQHLKQGIKLLCHLSETSDVTAEQLLIIRPADNPLSVLKVIMNVSLLTGIKTGTYCLIILINLLRKDFTMLRKLMELNLIEKIFAVLQIDWENAVLKNILMRVMELTTETLLASKSTSEQERVYGKMQQVGVLNLMQQLQEHKNREVYVKAEHFMHVVSDYKRRHN